jgi:diaminohydroxyphosphoribosylaminopyrimidine deaminase/5-amino-6-(5-phosphoribosylamino)uracil reductase
LKKYIKRCFDLAILGISHVSPNPMVGAVIVYQDRIIGEGYHKQYGQAHAEVNALASVAPQDRPLLPYSTIYISLEPCNIYGNTPPCTQLILKHKIPRVVISYIDHTPGVDGSGIALLRNHGIEVITGVLENQGKEISQVRNTYVQRQRPYIILKYAQSINGIFAPESNQQLWLTNPYSKTLVHRWRSEVQSILVGRHTVQADNPKLTNRRYYGPSPIRIAFDKDNKLSKKLAFFDGEVKSIIVTQDEQIEENHNVEYLKCPDHKPIHHFLLDTLTKRKISTLLVEGGIQTLNYFIKDGLWDEARIFVAPVYLEEGRTAPTLPINAHQKIKIQEDRLLIFKNESPQSLNFH